MQRVKILIAILQVHKTAAGAMRNTYEQIEYFKSLNCEIHVISDLIDKEAITKAGAIAHKTIKWPGTGTWRRKFYNFQVQLWIKWHKPQLIIGHGDLSHQHVLCLHNSIHLAHELIHGTPLLESSEMWPIHTPQLSQKKFNHLIANSNLMKNDLVKRFNIPPEQITVVYPAFNHHKFTPVSSQEREAIRKNLGIKSGELIVGLITSGNFKKRGVDVFFNALKLLPDDILKTTRFWVVGKDKLPQPPSNIQIEQMPVRTDVETYYRALDIFVLPARIEEFGRVQLEAMACGVPVITTSQVGASELLSGQGREFILEKSDPNFLADRLRLLLKDQNLRLELSKISFQSAQPLSEAYLATQFDNVFKKYL